MRHGIAHRLTETAEVYRRVRAADGMGGWTTSWQHVATITVRVSQPHPAQQDTAARSEAQISHDVYMLPTSDVRRGDQLHVRGLVLDVIAVVSPSKPIYRKAECTSQQHEGAS